MTRSNTWRMRSLLNGGNARLWCVCAALGWIAIGAAQPAQDAKPATPVRSPLIVYRHSRSPKFRNPPRLPSIAGCYTLINKKRWVRDNCVPEEYVRTHYPRPEVQAGIQFSDFSNQQTGYTMPITGGAIDIGFSNLGSEIDSSSGAGYFSIQLNSNLFSLANGDQAAVQFIDFHSPSTAVQKGDLVCIWSIDATANTYHSQCHAALVGRAPRSGDFVSVQAYQDFQEPGYLKMVFQLTWDMADGTYGLVAPDMYGLTHAMNATGGVKPADNYSGNWNQLSGSILGYGNSSTANFSKTKLWIGLDASNCETNAENDCVAYPPGWWTWAATKPSVIVSDITGEQNNLSPSTSFSYTTPASGLPALQCPSWNGCGIEYFVTAP